ncbi:hypothetical protein B0H19DRAFT_1082206 [Mycena capillaripes]|nr:hypothetical protein B0H19DRAFT_1082206 [Mycena capillaripes]
MDSLIPQDPPSSEAAATFERDTRSLIKQHESNIEGIDTEIANVKSQMEAQVVHFNSLVEAQLRLRKLELEKITALWTKIPPIRKLPVELLAEIFLLVIPSPGFYGRRVVLGISHVSRHWREVAHNTPRLWASLTLRPPPKPTERYLNFTKAWFDRSGSNSLSLYIHVVPGGGHSHSHLASLMTVLLAVAHRWKKLETTQAAIQYFHSIPPDAFSNLEELGLTCSSESDLRIFSTAPRLRSISLRVFSIINSNTPVLHAPWAQLTELDISHSADSCRSILRTCENVEKARLHIYCYQEMAALPVQTLPYLKTLYAEFTLGFNLTNDDLDATGIAASFLGSFVLPLLEDFTLAMPWTDDWLDDTFIQF